MSGLDLIDANNQVLSINRLIRLIRLIYAILQSFTQVWWNSK